MIGYFDNSKKEYVITDMYTRRKLMNYLWNEETVCQCDQFGHGFSWMAEGIQRRDVERGVRNVYIKDKDTGDYYSANRNYQRLPFDKFEAHVGLGYHKVVSEYNGILTEFTILVPVEGKVTLFNVKIKNTGKVKKNISMYFCVEPKPALSWHDAYGSGRYDEELNGLIFNHDGFNLPSPYTNLFVGCDKKFNSYDVAHEYFRGVYNGYDNPIGLKEDSLSSKPIDFESDYVAAMEFDLSLGIDETKEFNFCAFACKNRDEIKEFSGNYLGADRFNKEIEAQKSFNDEYLDVFNLESPDEYLNTQVNIWLKRQLSLGKTWGRLYGKGYRDVMQDITAFASFDTELARKRIIHALSYQYEDGNPIRMFEPNFHFPYNDGGAWITGAMLSYLNESGDLDIFKENVPYLKGNSYENSNLKDAFLDEPYIAGDKKGNVFDHVKDAIDYLIGCRGDHNLVLWRGGDWNDSINNAGVQGKGESVWLSIATVKAINEWKQILEMTGASKDMIDFYENKKQELIIAIKETGLTDNGYIYGITDTGYVVGSEGRIFLNPQTWAVLAELDTKENLEKVMNLVEEKLKCPFGYVQCAPSFDKGIESVGRVSYFKKGLVENGAVYNHGVAFKIVADCMLGRGDLAYESFKRISYDNPENPNNGVEPYAVSNMYMGPENECIKGYAPMSWITGTAGWLYRGVTEYICGVKPEINGLKIVPCLPHIWDNIKVSRRFRNCMYNIEFIRSNENYIIVDGKKIEGDLIELDNRKKEREVKVYFN